MSAVTITPAATRPSGRRHDTLVVAAATVAGAVALGTVTSHGVLVAVLAGERIGPVAAGALLVAASATLQFGLGPLAARLSRRSGVRSVAFVAAAAYAGGLLGAALAPNVAVAVLVLATGTGIAGACTLTPMLGEVAAWPGRRRAVAVAIVSAGNGIGALVVAPASAWSIQTIGLHGTWVAMAAAGGVVLATCALAFAGRDPVLAAVPPPGRPVRRRWWHALRRSEPARVVWDTGLRRLYVAAVLGAAGMLGSLAYLVAYATSLGWDVAAGARLLGATSAIGILGRLVVSVTPAGHAFRVYRGSQALLAASGAGWYLAGGWPALLPVAAVALGVAGGLWSSSAPLVIADVYPERLTQVLGAIYTAPAVGGMLGPMVVVGVARFASLRAAGLLVAALLVTAYVLLAELSRGNFGSSTGEATAGQGALGSERPSSA